MTCKCLKGERCPTCDARCKLPEDKVNRRFLVGMPDRGREKLYQLMKHRKNRSRSETIRQLVDEEYARAALGDEDI